MTDLPLLVLMFLIAVFWLDSRSVQEIAIARCRQACEKAGFQFLDDTAPVWRIRLARDGNGYLRLRRTYTFDYSTTRGERRQGSIVMLGRTPVALEIENRSVLDHDPNGRG